MQIENRLVSATAHLTATIWEEEYVSGLGSRFVEQEKIFRIQVPITFERTSYSIHIFFASD